MSKMAEAMKNSKSIFNGQNDRYNGLLVSSDLEKCTSEDFPSKLEESLKQWSEKGRRGVWFKIFLDHSDWIPHLTKNGFKYHHAKDDYVMMYRWLPKDEICNIPSYAHTSVGVGSVVVNDENQVLVVQEKYYVNVPHWKLPGGYLEAGENLINAAIREVLEETGVQTEFITLLALRHAHKLNLMFDCSDMYFVVALKALSTDLKKCDRELQDCKWINIDEYLSHPNTVDLNRFFVQKYLDYKEGGIRINCEDGAYKFSKREYPYKYFYVMKDKL